MSFLTQPQNKQSNHWSFKTSVRSSPSGTFHFSNNTSLPVSTPSKWLKIVAQYNLKNQPQQKYEPDHSLPIGFDLFRVFLMDGVLDRFELNVTIPETLVKDEDDNTFMLFTEKGRLRKRKCSQKEFENILKATNTALIDDIVERCPSKYREYMDYRRNPMAPFLVARDSDGDESLFDKQLSTYKSFTENIFKPLTKNTLIQRYIFSRNLKAILFRYCYHTKNNGSTQSNFAFRVQNVQPIFKHNPRNDCYETSSSLAFIVLHEDKKDTFQLTTISGKCLAKYQKMSRSLVEFLEKLLFFRIQKIYVDFMVGIEDEVYLTNVKWIGLKDSVILKQLNLDNQTLTCTVYCKLCGMIYKRDEVSKNLTYKLLYELVEHLKKRTRKEDSINKVLHELRFNQRNNKPCQLCNVCYMLVVSEHQLIQVERELARTVNIKVKEQIFIEKIQPKNRKRPVYLAEDLNQWRLMLYFSQIKELDSSDRNHNLFLQYRLNNQPTLSDCLKLSQCMPKKTTVNVNQIKIHYFFSESLNIQKFLNETQIKIRITQGTDWNKYIAEGSSGTISHFKNKVTIDSGQRHSSNILLFFQDCKYCQLYLTIGLVLDGTYNTSELNMYKQKQIYMTDSSYHNCNSLPKQWMEMFSPKYALQTFDNNKNCSAYSPVCSYDEIRKMIGVKYLKGDGR